MSDRLRPLWRRASYAWMHELDDEEMAVAVITLKPDDEFDPSFPSVSERDADEESGW